MSTVQQFQHTQSTFDTTMASRSQRTQLTVMELNQRLSVLCSVASTFQCSDLHLTIKIGVKAFGLNYQRQMRKELLTYQTLVIMPF